MNSTTTTTTDGTFTMDWAAWWASVSPEFAFLLALPFVVAAIGLVADRLRRP